MNREKRFRMTASAYSRDRLPNGLAPMFDVLAPPKAFIQRYEGKILDLHQWKDARQEIVAMGYEFSHQQKAWTKKGCGYL
jgi:hypothetical protein